VSAGAVHITEVLLSTRDGCCGPANNHLGTEPALDVEGRTLDRFHEVLGGVRGVEDASQRALQSSPLRGPRFIEAFQDRGRAAW